MGDRCDYDAAVIGAGLLGCFTARNLARYGLKIGVFEKNLDLCAGMSRANTAIIYPGYDPAPGSLKARLSLAAIRDFDRLCEELGVRFRRAGSLMVSFGPRGDGIIRQKYDQGIRNGVEGLRIISGAETVALEPNIRPSVTSALYAPSTATVNPWELGIAAAENAAANGVQFYFSAKVTAIRANKRGFVLEAGGRVHTARAVVNCAGLHGDEVSGLLDRPWFTLELTGADYLVLDDSADGFVRHIILHEPEYKGRGANLVPTADGNLLLGPSKRPAGGQAGFETREEGVRFVMEASRFVFPDLPLESVIRGFASLRPSISLETGEQVKDLTIRESETHPGFISLAGIKTPGLTCCNEIGKYVTEMLLDRLGNPGVNAGYTPGRAKPFRFSESTFREQQTRANRDPAYARIVCRCRQVTEGEIRNAIRRIPGAVTADGVKRRTGALMGRCQGGFCLQRVVELLAEELGTPASEIFMNEAGSWMIGEQP
jgi:glycerol-3-phosphate dehydrogenase